MDYLTKSILLELLNFSTSQNKKLFVVGGAMRDYLSQKSCSDFDLTGKNEPNVAKRVFNGAYITWKGGVSQPVEHRSATGPVAEGPEEDELSEGPKEHV